MKLAMVRNSLPAFLLLALLLPLGLCSAPAFGQAHPIETFSPADLPKYRKDADLGDASAEYKLGALYVFGDGVPQDYAEGVRWWRKAAEQGDVDAQFSLGFAYNEGEGVTQDYEAAVGWY